MNRTEEGKQKFARKFVIAWQRSDTFLQLCNRLRLTKAQARFRAHWYRRHGVELKQFPHANRARFDWEGLSRLAKRALKDAKTS